MHVDIVTIYLQQAFAVCIIFQSVVGQELGQKLGRPRNTVWHAVGQCVAAQCMQKAVHRTLSDLNVTLSVCCSPGHATEH